MKKILSILSFLVMSILAYKTVRTFAYVTSVFAILSIISMISVFIACKCEESIRYIMNMKDATTKVGKLSLTTLYIYIILLFVVSYGIVFIPFILSVLCVCVFIFFGMIIMFY